MPKITLTEFLRIVSANGTSKAKEVAKAKNQTEYHPAKDFYKPIRERITGLHRQKQNREYLWELLPTLTDKNKLKHYPDIIKGYLKWLKKNQFEWHDPSNSLFQSHGVDVSVKPDAGLEMEGNELNLKFYFKDEPLKKERAVIALRMMEIALKDTPEGKKMAILDVRRGKIFYPAPPSPAINAALSAELAYIADLWPHV